MKVNHFKILFLTTILLCLSINLSVIYAQTTSSAPGSGDIAVTNNTGKADTVVISNLGSGDKVNVYNSASGGKLLGSAYVYTNKTEAIVRVSQLGTADGSIYVSVICKGESESSRTKVDYPAEAKTEAPFVENIAIVNNVGKSDTVTVTGLYGGELLKVYNAASGGKLLGSVGTSASKTEATVSIRQLGIPAGTVYVSLTNKGEIESDRTKVDYLEECKSEPIDASYVSVTNNAGVNDTILVTYLSVGDVVKVYDSVKGGTLLGSAAAPYSKTEASITVTQLSKSADSIYVSITNKGKLESDRTKVDYLAEPITGYPDTASITVTNNGGISDTVTVANLNAGDMVKVYNSASGGTMLGSATVPASKTETTVTIAQLGITNGSVYISITGKGKFESKRIRANYSGESESDYKNSDDITITNNAGTSDTVKVINLTGGDVVKVYDSAVGGTLLGSAIVASANTEATVSISQLGTSAGYVYVSVTGKGKLESKRTSASYSAEPVSDSVDVNNITITNRPAGKTDTVNITNLAAGDVVKVYNAASGGSLLGSAAAAASNTEATVSISQLGTSAGSVYISITSINKIQGTRIKADYSAESQSDTVDLEDIVVTNNVASIADTVEVTNLNSGDIVKVYDKLTGGKLLSSATVPDYSSYLTITIPQLGTSAGSVYVSVTAENKIESSRTKVDYSAEGKSDTVDAANITVTNNAGTSDSVQVTGLTANDVVKVYDSAKGGTLLGSATVSAYSSYTTVSISQLGTSAGSIYITITSANKIEGDRVKADYTEESKSDSVNGDNIIVTNNAGASDTIQVTGLKTDDVVKVYDSAKGGTLLGSAGVSTGSTATVSIPQLGTSAGSVYVSITGAAKLESERTKLDFPAEAKSNAPDSNRIEIINNVGAADIVKVTGLIEGDAVNVYDSAKAGSLLGSAEVATYDTAASISITQLGGTAGSVYVSITSKNKLESDRTQADYSAESKSDAPAAGNISIVNNAGMSDTVTVTGLSDGDVVNIYDSDKGGSLLDTATISTYSSTADISITQLGITAGSIYVSVTSKSKLESDRTKADYSAEPKSSAPNEDRITIANNAGISDTVKVTGISGGDTVRVYDSAIGGTLLGTAAVSTYDSYAVVNITQLGSTAGSVYVSVTRTGYQESDRTKGDYSAEPKSGASASSSIIVTNNAGVSDTVQINGLSGGDVINIYNSERGGTILGTGTVDTYDSHLTITITQLGSSSGTIYVSVIRMGKLESDRTAVPYAAEQKSDPPAVSDITVTNNAGISDTIEVSYLDTGDMVKVYDSETGGTLLGSEVVDQDSTEAAMQVSQLGSSAGAVYVTVTSPKKLESERSIVYYTEEVTTDTPEVGSIKVTNNYKIADTVTVSFLDTDDIVKAYSAASGGTLLGAGTVGEDDTDVTIKITQLGDSEGNIYVSVTAWGKKESTRTKVSYTEEQKSTAPSPNNIVVKNNAGMADTVTAAFLDAGDVIKIYDAESAGNLLAAGTAEEGSTELTVKITQLGTSAGTVYISVTTSGKKESDRTMVYYTKEATSDAPSEDNIIVENNTGKSDTVRVIGLEEYDIVKVYNAASGGSLLGTATAAEDEDEAAVKIAQLGTFAGKVYVSVTSVGAYESERTEVGYGAEN